MNIAQLPDVADLASLSDYEFQKLIVGAVHTTQEDRKQNAILYYKAVSPKVQQIHDCAAKVIGIGGGNGSGKSVTALAELVMATTGVFPYSQRHLIDQKFKGPIQARLVVESLTTTLETIILPKLMWWRWSGVDAQGGERGHWGLIPKNCLIDGEWLKSYSQKLRMLRVLCRDPYDPEKVIGESTIQCMCLRGDQRVRMADSTWREIKDVREGEMVMRPNGKPTKVVRTYEYADAPLIRVRCRGGREIVATPNHRHPLADGRIVETSDLVLGDVIATNRDLNVRGADALPPWALGWVAVMIGDGCIKFRQAKFTAKAPSRVLNDLPPLPPNTKLKDCGGGRWDWMITLIKGRRYNPLVVLLKKLGLWGKGSKDKFVPEEIFRQSQESRAFFLRHLWNTDGTVFSKGRQAAYSTISRKLAYDVKYLLWSLGIEATVGDVNGVCGFTGKATVAFHTTVSGGSFDRFISALAGEDFGKVKTNPKGMYGKIKALEDAGHGTVYCLEVDAPDHLFIVDGLATHNSVDQDATDFASGDFHFVLHDEPPPLAIWRENEARTMRVDGRLMLAMTWPDDPSINVDWLYNEVYEPGRTGNDPAIRWFELWTTENQNLKQDAVATQAAKWSTEIADVRIYGRPIRFSNRIHPEFSDGTKTWCFNCDKAVAPMPGEYKAVPVCPVCQSENLVEFNHVQEFDLSHSWPTVFVIDPHPRKPHMFAWIQISPSDDWSMVAEGKCEGDCTDVFKAVTEIEGNLGLFVAQRLMDPNMGAQPSGQRREINWRDEFGGAGLMCDLADDSSVGRTRVNTMLKPDPHTHAPRLIFHKRCKDAIYQMERFVWDNWSSKIDKDEKQKPKEKYDDYPAILRYLANSEPNFRFLKNGAPVIGSGTRRKRAYA